jgi:hypothetical protein
MGSGRCSFESSGRFAPAAAVVPYGASHLKLGAFSGGNADRAVAGADADLCCGLIAAILLSTGDIGLLLSALAALAS